MIDRRLRQRRVGQLAEFAQAHVRVRQPQLGELRSAGGRFSSPRVAASALIVLDLLHRGLGGLLQVRGLGVHEPVHVVAHALDDAHVLGAQQRAMRAHEREERDDRLGALEVHRVRAAALRDRASISKRAMSATRSSAICSVSAVSSKWKSPCGSATNPPPRNAPRR